MGTEVEEYVSSAQDGLVQVVGAQQNHHQQLKGLGGRQALINRHKWTIPFSSDHELAQTFSSLRDMGFAFGGSPSGWPPSAIFEDLRDKGLLEGKFIEVVWTGKDSVRKIEK